MNRLYGIDISEHNGKIDFNKIKEDGVQFIMIRASWGHFVQDSMVERNVKECERVGIPFGFYHYSYADNEKNARIEAESFLKLCQKLGGYTYPLCLDMEDADHWKKRNGIGDEMNLKTIKIFKDVIEGAGEYLTLYMSKSWFDRLRKRNRKLIDSIDPWLAHWGIKEPSMECGMWQYSSDGVVKGSSKRTDVNYCYKDYPAIIEAMKERDSKPVVKPSKPVAKPSKPSDSSVLNLKDEPLYASSTSKTVVNTVSGKYYVWSPEVMKGRIRITNAKSRIGVEGQVTGWVKCR